MKKADFIKEIVEFTKQPGSDNFYSKLHAIKYLRSGPCYSLGLRGCKELVDEVTMNQPLVEEHFNKLYVRVKEHIDNYKRDLVKTTEHKKLYSCVRCGGVGGADCGGEVVKEDCTFADCVGRVVGDVTVVTTIKRRKLMELDGVRFYEKGMSDVIMWIKKHAADNMLYVCWESTGESDSGQSQMLRVVVEGFFESGKWIKAD